MDLRDLIMVKNLLIVNQPMRNRGDESAHKALIRMLLNRFTDINIEVLVCKGFYNEMDIEEFKLLHPKVNYVMEPIKPEKAFWYLVKRGIYQPCFKFFWMFHPGIVRFIKHYLHVDLIICAPGGICMGGFQNWEHLFLLHIAKLLNKPIAYFGRSIGPFPERTLSNRNFKKGSISLLKYMGFISLRDQKSFDLCKSLGYKCELTADTAFLDQPRTNLPDVFKEKICNKKYLIMVPNLLIWHYAFKNKLTRDNMVGFFSKLADVLFEEYPNHRILLLPQTFGHKNDENIQNDIHFFREIKDLNKNENLIVVDDKYSSDIQQSIIANAEFLTGARYHSIVFAINNNIPFVALSYEHKIEGLLEILNKKDCMIDISGDRLGDTANLDSLLEEFRIKVKCATKDEFSQKEAKRIVSEGADKFLNYSMSL